MKECLMRLLVNLVLVTALMPVSGIYAQRVATSVKPLEVTRYGAAAETVIQSRLSGLTPQARSGILASIRRSPEVRTAESVEAAKAALAKIPQLKPYLPAIASNMTEVLKTSPSTAFDSVVKTDTKATMAAISALLGEENCSLRDAAQEGGAVSISERDREIAFAAAADLNAVVTRSEFFDALPASSIEELNKTLDGLDINKDPMLREGAGVLVRNLNSANEALIARFSEDGVVTAEEAKKIADCQVIEAGKRIAAEQGLPEANGIQMGVELAQACNFGDSLTESASKAQVDAYIAQCN
jgi:hypothetical protein